MSSFRSLRYRLQAFVPDLLDIQCQKFGEFITIGIARSLRTINPIQAPRQNIRLVLYPQHFQVVRPNLTPREATLRNKTYEAGIYVPAHVWVGDRPAEAPHWVFVGSFPFMTSRGQFIINGVTRVIVNQVVRRPGLYFRDAIQGTGERAGRTVFGDFICRRGTWVRIQLDKKGASWMCLKRTPKLNLYDVIDAFKAVEHHLAAPTTTPYFIASERNSEIIEDLTKRLRLHTSPENSGESLYQFLYSRFKNPRVYDLGLLARRSINNKLELDERSFQLTANDLQSAHEYLLAIRDNTKVIDDIDNLSNRRVRPAGDLFESQLDFGLSNLGKAVRRRLGQLKHSVPARALIESKQVNQAFREFFGASTPLAQYLDQVNPLSDVTHKRRISAMGPGGVSRDNANLDMRNIHVTHYGRICPIETPEGKNVGLVNTLTAFGHVTTDGYIETPYYRVARGQVQERRGPLYFSPPQEQSRPVRIAPPDLYRDASGALPLMQLPARVVTEVREDFVRVNRADIDYISIAPSQLMSIATSLIPFLEHDDANRALMGSNMQRQTVPVMRPERPIVGTGLEGLVVGESGHIVQAANAGIVSYVSSQRIVIQHPTCASCSPAISMAQLPAGATSVCPGFFLSALSNISQSSYVNRGGVWPLNTYLPRDPQKPRPQWPHAQNTPKAKPFHTHPLYAYDRSNQETALLHRPIVNEGDWVQRGDLLADCAASVHGSLALGQNLLVAYVPWEGYNFEDAVVISERLVFDEVYTTIHIEKYEAEVRQLTGPDMEVITKWKIPGLSMRNHLALDDSGIVRVGRWVVPGDILIGKAAPLKVIPLTPYERLAYDILDREPPKGKDVSLRVPHGVRGRIVNTQILKSDKTDGPIMSDMLRNRVKHTGTNPKHPNKLPSFIPYKVRVFIAEKRRIQVGDKVAGRHGNKGIISCILPPQDMPYLPDGSTVDMVLNPLGVPSRMNVGQVFECLLGLAGSYLGQEFRVTPFDEVFGPEASRSLVYLKLYQARLKTKQKWLFQPNFPGKMRVFDGRTGEPFDQFVTVGRAYMLKLVHLVEEKIHARATGGYAVITQQPVGGRSRNGGQRLGEMEVWALEAYGAAYALQELLTVKSDDLEGRVNTLDSILETDLLTARQAEPEPSDGPPGYITPAHMDESTPMKPPAQEFNLGTSEAFRVLLLELQSLCLDVGVYALTMPLPNWKLDPDTLTFEERELSGPSCYRKVI